MTYDWTRFNRFWKRWQVSGVLLGISAASAVAMLIVGEYGLALVLNLVAAAFNLFVLWLAGQGADKSTPPS